MENDLYIITEKARQLSELIEKEVDFDIFEPALHIDCNINNNSGLWICCTDTDDLYNTIGNMITALEIYKGII